MDWDKLRIFHAVAEAGSFTRAGETLALSQSAISRQISALEDSLGVPLFHRHARGLILTEQGELLYKTAQDIFNRLYLIEGELLDSRELAEGPLLVTAAEFIGTTWLAPQLAGFRANHPDIQVTMLLEDRILNLSMREADAAVRLYKPEQQDLIQRHLTTINFHLCASRTYLNKYGTPSTIEELREHTLIGFPEGKPAPFHDPNWLLRVADVDEARNRNLILINSITAIYQAVRNGAGIAALPDYMVRDTAEIVSILPEIEREGVDMYFVYPEERRKSKRIAALRDSLLKHVEKNKFLMLT